jgi:hypothetical protein
MQVLQAGQYKLLLLELESEVLLSVAMQAGFECKLDDGKRSAVLDLVARERQAPLLLFDAADPANLGWFSRCQFYVDGQTGAVLQTPISVANQKDRSGQTLPTAVLVRVSKELPATFRLPGRTQVTEQTVYALLFNFLSALLSVGVGVCGGPVVRPLAGRTEGIGVRN